METCELIYIYVSKILDCAIGQAMIIYVFDINDKWSGLFIEETALSIYLFTLFMVRSTKKNASIQL